MLLLGFLTHEGLLLSGFLSQMYLFEGHKGNWVANEALLDALVVGEDEFLDDRVDLLMTDVQLRLEVLRDIAQGLFHFVNEMCLAVKINFFVRDLLV